MFGRWDYNYNIPAGNQSHGLMEKSPFTVTVFSPSAGLDFPAGHVWFLFWVIGEFMLMTVFDKSDGIYYSAKKFLILQRFEIRNGATVLKRKNICIVTVDHRILLCNSKFPGVRNPTSQLNWLNKLPPGISDKHIGKTTMGFPRISRISMIYWRSRPGYSLAWFWHGKITKPQVFSPFPGAFPLPVP